MNVAVKNTYENKQFVFDIKHLKQGFYILRSRVNGQTVIHRFTKL
jgi:hypothetical protein